MKAVASGIKLILKVCHLTDDGQQSVQVSGLAQGQYTVYYLQNGTVLDSENMIVE
jgi:hypothetical protein